MLYQHCCLPNHTMADRSVPGEPFGETANYNKGAPGLHRFAHCQIDSVF